ncbi:hypothetical protein JCM8547_001371 [Rhodosporidiobolus lusitaniae]
MSSKSSKKEGTTGRKRNRKVASCNPCRARRIRCDRGHPCAACLQRGDDCQWDPSALAPLFERREENENERLRSEVDRLQRLVDVLVSANPHPDIPLSQPPPYPTSLQGSPPDFSSPPLPDLSPAHLPRLPELPIPPPARQHQQQQQLHQQLHQNEQLEQKDDLEAHDLVRKLSELTIKTFQLGTSGVEDPRGDSLVKEAQTLLDAKSPSDDLTTNIFGGSPHISTSATLALLPASSTPTTTLELMARVPPRPLVQSAVQSYRKMISWYLHPIPDQVYDRIEDEVFLAKERNEAAPAFSLAVVFAVYALGLFSSGIDQPAYASYSKSELAVALVELSRTALAIGRFLEQPTLDAIRALILLATHYAVLAPGDDGGAGIGLLALAVQGCLQLDLHRDPDKRGGHNLTFAEKEDRRRLFHLVFMKDAEVASVMGRRFTLLHIRDTDTKLPLDLDDRQLDEPNPRVDEGRETIMSTLLVRMKVAMFTEQVTEEVFGIHPVPYSRILALDRQLNDLEKEMPEMFKWGASDDLVQAVKSLILILDFLQERMRLHRPYLARAFADDTYAPSRFLCVQTARQILELLNHPCIKASYACMLYKAIQAGVVLCLETMYLPHSETAAEDKKLILSAVVRLEGYKSISTICRRGSKLLRFLLDKIDSISHSFRLNEEDAPLLKRTRTSPGALRPLKSKPTVDPSVWEDQSSSPESPKRKLPRVQSVPSNVSSAALDHNTGRTSLPLPYSRPRAGSTASSTSQLSSMSYSAAPSTASSSSVFNTAGSSLSHTSTSNSNTASRVKTAADEIAALDFPALLGLDGNAAPFSFDFSTPSSTYTHSSGSQLGGGGGAALTRQTSAVPLVWPESSSSSSAAGGAAAAFAATEAFHFGTTAGAFEREPVKQESASPEFKFDLHEAGAWGFSSGPSSAPDTSFTFASSDSSFSSLDAMTTAPTLSLGLVDADLSIPLPPPAFGGQGDGAEGAATNGLGWEEGEWATWLRKI